MSGGLIQLVAVGIQDIFLTGDPQITYFKTVYRRYTNFSIEAIPQFFDQSPDFGKKVTATLTRSGDLLGQTFIVLDLPAIPEFITEDALPDTLRKFAWVKKVGYALIKYVEVEIGGQRIDKHWGEWLNIWSELTETKNEALDNMIGNVTDNVSYTSSKTGYRLFIPLFFWFCRHRGLALPLVCLQYNDVKITIELNDANTCYVIGPTHDIPVRDDIVHFTPFEYIEQTVDSVTSAGIFVTYDVITKKLYYIKATDRIAFRSLDANALRYTGRVNPSNPEPDLARFRADYIITGLSSNATAYPQDNTSEEEVDTSIDELHIPKCFLLIDYYFLDREERIRFMKSKHEYLIEQLQYSGESALQSNSALIRLPFNQPCKELIWISQLDSVGKGYLNDRFNYTDSYKYVTVISENDEYYYELERSDREYQINIPAGKNLVYTAELLLNSQVRSLRKNGNYYNYLVPYYTHTRAPALGINGYSFSLFPEDLQPTGTCNMSRVDDIALDLQFQETIDSLHPAKFRAYCTNYNILKISNGIGGLLFIN